MGALEKKFGALAKVPSDPNVNMALDASLPGAFWVELTGWSTTGKPLFTTRPTNTSCQGLST